LSGIVVFNVESVYCRLQEPAGASDFRSIFSPTKASKALAASLKRNQAINPSFYGDAYFPKEVQDHFLWGKNPTDFLALAKRLKRRHLRNQGDLWLRS
jgi:hypothetical protein